MNKMLIPILILEMPTQAPLPTFTHRSRVIEIRVRRRTKQGWTLQAKPMHSQWTVMHASPREYSVRNADEIWLQGQAHFQLVGASSFQLDKQIVMDDRVGIENAFK